MSKNDKLKEELKKLLPQKKSKAYYAEKLGITETKVEELKLQIKGIDTRLHTVEKTIQVDNSKGTWKSEVESSFEPKSDSELAKLHRIDLTKYKISSYWSKLKQNGKFTSSVFCTLKKPDDYNLEDFTKFLKTYSPKPIKISNYNRVGGFKKIVDVEISIADYHLDRQTLKGDTVEERKQQYKNLVSGLVQQVQGSHHIRELVFVIGNDFFNTDNYQGQTTRGTPQESNTTWHNAYEEGFDLLVSVIAGLNSQAEKVTVVLVQGNHDRTKSYYLAHALEVFFKDYKKVSFIRHNSNTKYIILGKTFIGYHHGDQVKIEGLPLYFASNEESSLNFGLAKYREVHTGDKHFAMTKDIQGTIIRQLPSMVNSDNFSNDGLYLHTKSALALCYHPEKGKCAEFEERL